MRGMEGWRSRLAALVAAVALAVTWLGVGGPPKAVSYNQWSQTTKCNVGASGAGLWRDAPGAGRGLESAFVWAKNTGGSSEFCTWFAPVANVASSTFPELRVTAAVNDGSLLSLAVFNTGGTQIATTSAFIPNNAFQTVTLALPPGQVIGRVEMTISDSPVTAANSGKSSALVDDIRIWNSVSGVVAWSDDFTEAG